jgi:hypothetical protein
MAMYGGVHENPEGEPPQNVGYVGYVGVSDIEKVNREGGWRGSQTHTPLSIYLVNVPNPYIPCIAYIIAPFPEGQLMYGGVHSHA